MDLNVLADRVFDGDRLLLEPLVVVVRGGLIERVVRGGAADAPGPAPILDARGSLLLPGLVNAHVHAARAGMFEPEEPLGIRHVVKNLRGALAAGVTTVGDMGCAAPLAAALRRHIDEVPDAGPAFVASGPLITAPRGYPLDWMPAAFVRLGLVLACDDERAAAAAVERIARSGMDHVKIAIMHTSYADQPLPALSVNVARAVVDEAHRLGLSVFAHAHGVADYDVALAARVDALMHSSFEPLDATMVARIQAAGIPVCPTLWVFESACLGPELGWHREPRFARHVTGAVARSWHRYAEAWAASGAVVPEGIAGGASKARAREAVRVAAANLLLLRDAGVPIAFGNDSAYGLSLLARPVDELGAMQRAGLDALECLRAATAGAARLLGRTDRGLLAPGKRADLLVVDAAAERDVSAVERVGAVVQRGRLVEETGLVGDARTALAHVGGMVRTVLGALRS